jgi:hypothetical protein
MRSGSRPLFSLTPLFGHLPPGLGRREKQFRCGNIGYQVPLKGSGHHRCEAEHAANAGGLALRFLPFQHLPRYRPRSFETRRKKRWELIW